MHVGNFVKLRELEEHGRSIYLLSAYAYMHYKLPLLPLSCKVYSTSIGFWRKAFS